MNEDTRRMTMCVSLLSTIAILGCDVGDGAKEDLALGTTAQSISLESALGAPVNTSSAPSSTCGLNNGVTPSCTTSTASDLSFGWQAPSAGTYTFTTSGSNFDTVLVIAPYDNPSSLLACRNAVSGTGGESQSLTLSTGQMLLITIDGYASLCGTYHLNITKNCTTPCNTACHTGACSVDGQCVKSSAGTACDDSDACTINDTCNSTGSCVPGTNTCSQNYCDSFGLPNLEECGPMNCCVIGSGCSICV